MRTVLTEARGARDPIHSYSSRATDLIEIFRRVPDPHRQEGMTMPAKHQPAGAFGGKKLTKAPGADTHP